VTFGEGPYGFSFRESRTSESVFGDGVGLETSAKTSCGATTPAPTMRPQLFNSSRRVKSLDIEVNLTSGLCGHCLVFPIADPGQLPCGLCSDNSLGKCERALVPLVFIAMRFGYWFNRGTKWISVLMLLYVGTYNTPTAPLVTLVRIPLGSPVQPQNSRELWTTFAACRLPKCMPFLHGFLRKRP
jgi:hypothetical protein